ncbi:YneF family protein [symbiont of Argiope bruennichi]|uniref:YneF family protein n=1 Tax=symbiont of Argiope bruennichi TaxID=2810479 RepID=UPI003DA213C8
MVIGGIFIVIIIFVISLGVGFFLAKKKFEKWILKNPPLNKKMIKELYKQLGKIPKEQDINMMLNSINRYNQTK